MAQERRNSFERALLKASKSKYKVLFDVAPVAIIEAIWDRDFKVVQFNPSALSLFKAADSEAFLKEFPKLIKRIPKKNQLEILAARVKSQVYEGDFFLPSLDKGARVCVLMRLVFPDAKNSSQAILTFQDITKYKRQESDLKKLVQLDGLTKIFNQRTIVQRLEQELSRAKRYNLDLTCIIFDLDDFKNINDTFGHLWGNKCIKQVAKQLKISLRKTDIVGRYGGDEFLVILPETKPDQSFIPIKRFLDAYKPYAVIRQKGKSLTTTFSIGVSGYPNESLTTAKNLIAAADEALYKCKEAGGNTIHLHQPKPS